MKKVVIPIFLFFIIFSSLVLSATTVVTQATPVPEKTGIMSSVKGFFTSPLFWGLIAFLLLAILIGVVAYFLITWLIRYLKEQKDLFINLKRRRIKLAKAHSRYNTHGVRITKNSPIRLVRKKNNRAEISSPIGYYRGDYTTHEGNILMAFNFPHKKKLFVLPVMDVLIIPNKPEVHIHKRDTKGKVQTTTIENLPLAKDIVQFNNDEVLLYAESISDVGEFHVPVLKAKDGRILDLSLPVYHTLKEAVIDNYLYDQTSQFATLSKRGLEINPFVKTAQKLQDSAQNQETPQMDRK
jgi:hypothetical protein